MIPALMLQLKMLFNRNQSALNYSYRQTDIQREREIVRLVQSGRRKGYAVAKAIAVMMYGKLPYRNTAWHVGRRIP